MIFEPPMTHEPPRELTPKNVIYWSEHYMKLKGTDHGKAIQTKARIFLKKGCIEYDPNETKYDAYEGDDGHRFICKPIPGYNSTTYRLWQNKETRDFECSCQFYQKTKLQCSHITALWMQIKIWNYHRVEGGVKNGI